MTNAVRYVVRKFWGLCAALLIALALVVQLGREFSPTLEFYREDLADYLSESLGVDARLQGLSAEWEGLAPSVSVSGLQLLGTSDEPVFTIDRAVARLDLLESLLAWRLVWGELEMHGLQAFAEQLPDGHWQVKGMERSTALDGRDTSRGAIDDPFDVFLLGPHIELKDAQVNFSFQSGHRTHWAVPRILVENAGDFHRLSVKLDVDEHSNALSLVLEGRGDPRDRDAFKASGHLKVQQFPTEKVLALLAADYWQGADDKRWRNGGRLDLEAWLSSRKGGGLNFEGSLNLQGLPLEPRKGATLPEGMVTAMRGHWRPEGDWQFALQDLALDWGDKQAPPLNLSVGSGGLGKPLEILADRLDLGSWYGKVADSGILTGRLADVLADLNPTGTLNNIQVSVPANASKDWRFRANLQKVSVGAWQGAPALEQVDGYVEAHKGGGFVDLDSREGFSMHYPVVYREPMRYQSVKGQVAWSLQPENNAIFVNSGPIRFQGDDGSAAGLLYLYLPWLKDTAMPEMILQIGLQNSHARYYKKYVPFTVPDTLETWLEESLGEGRVPEAGFIYRGSLRSADADQRTVQLSLEIDDAELNYHPRWPGLKHLQGRVSVDDVNVNARVHRGELYDSQLGDTEVTVKPNPAGEGAILGVHGQLTGDASDGLRVLRESMLRDTLGSTFDSWALNGVMSTELALSVPLSAGAPGSRQKVLVDLKQTRLAMDNLRLDVDRLSGQIVYDNQSGLSAQDLAGSLWQQPVSVSIDSLENKGGRDTRVKFTGKVATDKLARWTRRPEIYFAEGELSYDGELLIPAGQAETEQLALLNVSSNLKGVSLDLPAPYGKSAETEMPLQVRVPIDREHTLYDVQLGDWGQGLFEVGSDKFRKGTVALGLKAVLPVNDVLVVTGRAERLDYDEWQAVWQRYKAFSQRLDQELGAEIERETYDEFATSVDLNIHELTFGGYALEALELSGERSQEQWLLQAENSMVAGNITVFDDSRPMSLDLDYLRLPSTAVETEQGSEIASETPAPSDIPPETPPKTPAEASDPLAGVDLSALIAMDFATREFKVGDEHYGEWAFQLRPSAQGVEARNIQALVRGTRIGGTPDTGEGAHLVWLQGEDGQQTRFQGRLMSGDLGEVMKQWQQPVFIESRNANFNADFLWQGSPAALTLAGLQGDLTLDVDEGRFIRTAGVGSSAFLRLISLLNFDTLVRRLRLDFSDVYKSGMAYDDINAHMRFEAGSLFLSEPLRVKTPSSKLQLAGTIDMQAETMDTTLVATLPVGENLTLLTALAAGLPAAAGVYVASKLFSKQVDKVASVSYSMNGPWDDPAIEFERLFDSGAAKKTAKTTRAAETKARRDMTEKALPNPPEPDAVDTANGEKLPLDSSSKAAEGN